MYGTAKPEYSWTNLPSVLYVEQTIGTGYSLGEPNAKVGSERLQIKPVADFDLLIRMKKMSQPNSLGSCNNS
jgi:carboxypeptidase C (cathepsin A)